MFPVRPQITQQRSAAPAGFGWDRFLFRLSWFSRPASAAIDYPGQQPGQQEEVFAF